ncbi:hypothetical protein KY285_001491 [Solanum tuberosum]|nr:hypothetical protein KY289_001776 [Solanum tuberosum]KAH0765620.1 hypothetical protein KY285_001491 [Solanum tuberosum]
MSSEKSITLKTSDGEEFKLDETVAVRSEVFKNIVQDQDCASNVIPLSNVDGKNNDETAKNLDDKELRDVMSQEVADRITGKTLEEIREEFGSVNDYTPEEEKKVRRENAWAFE